MGIYLTPDLLPKDAIFTQADKPWMKEFIQRVDDEANYDKDDPFWEKQKKNASYPYHFYPFKTETCSPENSCGLPIDLDLITSQCKFEGKAYSAKDEDQRELQKHYSLYYNEDDIDKLFDSAQETGL